MVMLSIAWKPFKFSFLPLEKFHSIPSLPQPPGHQPPTLRPHVVGFQQVRQSALMLYRVSNHLQARITPSPDGRLRDHERTSHSRRRRGEDARTKEPRTRPGEASRVHVYVSRSLSRLNSGTGDPQHLQLRQLFYRSTRQPVNQRHETDLLLSEIVLERKKTPEQLEAEAMLAMRDIDTGTTGAFEDLIKKAWENLIEVKRRFKKRTDAARHDWVARWNADL